MLGPCRARRTARNGRNPAKEGTMSEVINPKGTAQPAVQKISFLLPVVGVCGPKPPTTTPIPPPPPGKYTYTGTYMTPTTIHNNNNNKNNLMRAFFTRCRRLPDGCTPLSQSQCQSPGRAGPPLSASAAPRCALYSAVLCTVYCPPLFGNEN